MVGGRRARPESSIGLAGSPASIRIGWTPSSSPTARSPTGPTSRPTGRAGMTASRWSSRRTGAPATPAALDVRIDLWVGDGDSTDPADLDDARCGRRRDRARAHGQGRIRHRAGDPRRPRRGHGRRHRRRDRAGPGSTTRWRTWACWRCRSSPAGPGHLLDARSMVRLLRGRARAGRPPVGRRLVVGPGDLVSLIPFGGDARGVTTAGLRYPLVDEPLPFGPPRGALQRPSDRRRRSSLRRVSCSSSSRLLPSRHEHARRSATSHPRSPCRTTPAPSTGSPTSGVAGPSSTSTRPTTRPAAPSRPASSATATRDQRTRRRRLGHQPPGRREQAGASARSSTCRSRSWPTRLTRSPTRTARGSRSRTTARRTWARLRRPSWSTPTGGSRGRGPRSRRRAMPRRSWRRSTSCRPLAHDRGRTGRRLRSWGETSEASDEM